MTNPVKAAVVCPDMIQWAMSGPEARRAAEITLGVFHTCGSCGCALSGHVFRFCSTAAAAKRQKYVVGD